MKTVVFQFFLLRLYSTREFYQVWAFLGLEEHRSLTKNPCFSLQPITHMVGQTFYFFKVIFEECDTF